MLHQFVEWSSSYKATKSVLGCNSTVIHANTVRLLVEPWAGLLKPLPIVHAFPSSQGPSWFRMVHTPASDTFTWQTLDGCTHTPGVGAGVQSPLWHVPPLHAVPSVLLSSTQAPPWSGSHLAFCLHSPVALHDLEAPGWQAPPEQASPL